MNHKSTEKTQITVRV